MKSNNVTEIESNNDVCYDYEVYRFIHSSVANHLRTSGIKLQKFDFTEAEQKIYKYVKSYRTCVTEGNSTNVGQFTNILQSNSIDLKNRRIANTFDDQNELINTIKCYDEIKDIRFKRSNLNAINAILGIDIWKNNFCEHRGLLRKKGVCYIPFRSNEQNYRVVFTSSEKIGDYLNNLLEFSSKVSLLDEYDIFANYILMHNELISIHPFVDGNGRTTRIFTELYLEKFNILPFIPFSNKKQEYQMRMGEFSINKQEDILKAYIEFTNYIIVEYPKLNNDLLSAIKKLEFALNK